MADKVHIKMELPMYKMKSDINFSLTHEMLENAENERIHTSYAQEKAILECVSNGDKSIGIFS